MSDKKITQFPSGSYLPNYYIAIGDPVTGQLYHIPLGSVPTGSGAVTGASNGTTISASILQLGQSVGQGGNPGALVRTTELPLAGFNLQFTGSGAVVLGSGSIFKSLGETVLSGSVRDGYGSVGTNGYVLTNLSGSLAWTQTVLSASFAARSISASYSALSDTAVSASSAISSSYARTASFVISASYASIATSASYTLSSSYSLSSSYASIADSAPKYTLTSSFNSFSSSYVTDSASLLTLVTNTYLSESKYTTTASFLNFSSSYVVDSSSFDARIRAISGAVGYVTTTSFQAFTASFVSFSGSYVNDSSSWNLKIANVFASESNYTTTASFNTFSGSYVTNSASVNLQLANIFASESNYLPSSSINGVTNYYSIFTNVRQLGTASIFQSGSTNIIGATTYNGGVAAKLAIVGGFALSGAFYDSTNGVGNPGYVLVSTVSGTVWQAANFGQYVTTASFQTFTSSYYADSTSFDARINAFTGSIGGYVQIINYNPYTASVSASILQLNQFSSSIRSYTASNDTRVTNVFLSQSIYLPSASFTSFTASYIVDSGSFNTRINNVYASESVYLLSSSITGSKGFIAVFYDTHSVSSSFISLSGSDINIGTGSLKASSATVNGLGNAAFGVNASIDGNYNLVANIFNTIKVNEAASVAFGSTNTLEGGSTNLVEGGGNYVTGSTNTHVEGNNNFTRFSQFSHIEGSTNYAINSTGIHMEGSQNSASFGSLSHIEGQSNFSTNIGSHIEGFGNLVSGQFTHVGGFNNTGSGDYQTVIGINNIPDSTSIFIIGGGINASTKRNILRADTGSGGNIHISASLHISKSIYDSVNSPGSSGYVLTSTVSGTFWAPVSSSTFASSSIFALTASAYTLTSSFQPFTASILNFTASFYVFSASYSVDSASFDLRIRNISASAGNVSGYVPTASYNPFTASYYVASASFVTVITNLTNTVNNVYASESNYTPTASFQAFTSSYVADSSSFINRINAVYASESLYVLTSSITGGPGFIPVFNTSHSITNSIIYQTGSNIQIGNTSILPGTSNNLSAGNNNSISGSLSFVVGSGNVVNGSGSSAFGINNTALADYSSVRGIGNRILALATGSSVEGSGSTVLSTWSHIEGQSNNSPSGSIVHIEGQFNVGIGQASHAEGAFNSASGQYSHVEGVYNNSIGVGSHAGGSGSFAYGNYANAHGIGVVAYGYGQTVLGQYNTQNNLTSSFIIGNGTNGAIRSDIVLVNTSSVVVNGGLYVNGPINLLNYLYDSNGQTGSFGNVLTSIGSGVVWAPVSGGGSGSGGGVSSVGLNMPGSVFTVTGTPVTSIGVLTAAFVTQSAGTFLAAPTASNGVPSFRRITVSDISGSTTVNSLEFIVGDGGPFTPVSGTTQFNPGSNPLAGKTILHFAQEGMILSSVRRNNGYASFSFTGSSGIINLVSASFDFDTFYHILYK